MTDKTIPGLDEAGVLDGTEEIPIAQGGVVKRATADQIAARGITNPMTAVGDMIVGGAAGAPQRLGIGTNGWVLTIVAGIPVWQALSAGPISSVFGRTGAVAAASGDYTFAQIGSKPTTVAGYGITDALANPMTTAGDIITGGASGAAQRLGKGGDGQVLTLVSGTPAWQNATSGFANPMTTAGDIITGGASGAAQRLAKGSNGQVLTLVSGAPAWQSPASAPVASVFGRTGAVAAAANDYTFAQIGSKPTTVAGYGITDALANPMTTAGDIITGGASGAAQRLAKGGDGQVLTLVSGTPAWQNATSGFANPMTTTGDIITGGASGAAQRLAKGGDGQVLTLVSGAPAWQSPASTTPTPADGTNTTQIATTAFVQSALTYDHRRSARAFTDCFINASIVSTPTSIGDGMFAATNDNNSFWSSGGGQPSLSSGGGVITLNLNTTATGYGYVGSTNGIGATYSLGLGTAPWEHRQQLNALSTATNRYTLYAGFMDTLTATPTRGCFFRYCDNVNSGNWQCVCRSGGVETAVDSGIAAATASDFDRWKIVVNAAGTSVAFYRNDTLLTTITTNIPIGTYKDVGYGVSCQRSVGTAGIVPIYLDYLFAQMDFTTAR